jgi:hypothetical protein
MRSPVRIIVVAVVAAWLLGTTLPDLARLWEIAPTNGLTTNYDGVVTAVRARSAADRLSIAPRDHILAPLPEGLLREPAPSLSFQLMHAGALRPVDLAPLPHIFTSGERVRLIVRFLTYLIFLAVGSALLLTRQSAAAWFFYCYCASRRYAELGFYWPGSDEFFWFNKLALVAIGGACCAFVALFALRVAQERPGGLHARLAVVPWVAGAVLAIGWFSVIWRVAFAGVPSQGFATALGLLEAAVYLGAAAAVVMTLAHCDAAERTRLRWLWAFAPALISQAVATMLAPSVAADVFDALGVIAPLAAAYALWARPSPAGDGNARKGGR